jgi:diacylglycerol kinase
MKIIKSFGHAFRGLWVAVREERHVQIHLVALLVVACAGGYFEISISEWVTLILTASLVISLELINTALENLTDLVSPHHHALAGKVKDIAASAVLVASGAAVVIGCLIFSKYIF